MATVGGSVANIYVTQTGATFQFKGNPATYMLQYDHPGYSSIYAMLLGAATNSKVTLNVVTGPDADGLTTITGAELTFGV
jgi:hypothetical protein